MQISWNTSTDDQSVQLSDLDTLINYFEKRVWGWQLHPADLLLNGGYSHDQAFVLPPPQIGLDDRGLPVKRIEHSGFAALHIIMSYFEMIFRYHSGDETDDSKDPVHGLKLVYPDFPNKIGAGNAKSFEVKFRKNVRNALYHSAFVSSGVVLSGGDQGLNWDARTGTLTINPHTLVQEIKHHFASYISNLRDPGQKNLRDKFQKRILFELGRDID